MKDCWKMFLIREDRQKSLQKQLLITFFLFQNIYAVGTNAHPLLPTPTTHCKKSAQNTTAQPRPYKRILQLPPILYVDTRLRGWRYSATKMDVGQGERVIRSPRLLCSSEDRTRANERGSETEREDEPGHGRFLRRRYRRSGIVQCKRARMPRLFRTHF